MTVHCPGCGQQLLEDATSCPYCNTPVGDPQVRIKRRQKRFIVFFVAVVILCLVMVIWLPPNWPHR